MSYLQDLLGDDYREGMTEDEISSAIETKFEGMSKENTKLKASLSKSNSEASGYKKQLREKMSEEEQKNAAIQEEMETLRSTNAELTRRIDLSDKTAEFLGLGYDGELAKATATAYVDGNFDVVIANQRKFMETQKQNIIAEQLKKTPRPANGAEPGAMDYSAMIEQARKEGNFGKVAYYTRLSQTKQSE